MGKESIRYGLENFIKILASAVIYALIFWWIDLKVNETFGYLAGKEAAIKESMNVYLGNIRNIIMFALFLNFAVWWLMACIPYRPRYWFECSTLVWAMVLGLFLFGAIFVISCLGGATIDYFGNGQTLYYSYSIGCAFLINLFGLPPQAVKEVLMPCKGKTRYIVVVIAAFAIGIIMR